MIKTAPATLLLLALISAAPVQARSLKAAVTIAPLAEIVTRLGGAGTEVYVIIQPGQSPHGYEPTPGQVKKIASADIVVMAGLGLDNWLLKLAQAAGKDASTDVLDCSRAIDPKKLIESGGHNHEGAHDGHGDEIANPHWWLDPSLMAAAAGMIANRMTQSAGAGEKAGYEERLRNLERDLAALDALIKEELKAARGGFVAYHGAWDYFSRRYGLNQLGSIEPSPGKSPSAKKFAQLAASLRALGAGAVMAEPQFAQKLAQALADEGGVRLGMADPLGGIPGRNGYFEMMTFNARAFKLALK